MEIPAIEKQLLEAVVAAVKDPARVDIRDPHIQELVALLEVARNGKSERVLDYPIETVEMYMIEHEGHVVLYWGQDDKILAMVTSIEHMTKLAAWIPKRLSMLLGAATQANSKLKQQGEIAALTDYQNGTPYQLTRDLQGIALQAYKDKMSAQLAPIRKKLLTTDHSLLRSGEFPPGCVKYVMVS